jgi:hypothetical protein
MTAQSESAEQLLVGAVGLQIPVLQAAPVAGSQASNTAHS